MGRGDKVVRVVADEGAGRALSGTATAVELAPPTPPVSEHGVRRCAHVRNDGSPCRAPPLKDGAFCIAHDPRPEIVQRRKEALRKGGKTRVREGLKEWTPLKIDSLQDLKPLLTRTINLVGGGKMHPSVANAIAGLAGQYAKVSELSDLERRISDLEEVAKKEAK